MRIGILGSPTNFHTQKWALGLKRAGMIPFVFSFEAGEIPGVTCVRLAPTFTAQGRFTYLSYVFGGKDLRKALQAHQIDLLNPINVTPFGVWGYHSGFRPVIHIAMGADILEYPPRLADREIPWSRIYDSRGLALPGPAERLSYPLKWRLFRSQIQRTLDHADHVLGDNLQLTEAVTKWFGVPPDRVHLNRWGIEPDLFQPAEEVLVRLRKRFLLAPGQPLLVSPRGLKPVYQGDVIMEGLAELLARGWKEAKVLVLSAGYGAPREWDHRAITLMQQHSHFIYEPGLLTREEMAALWTLTTAFVVAPVYDGYSNALSEGRYIGAIPFVNHIPAHREIMEDGIHGQMVEPFTPLHLANAIEAYWPQHATKGPQIATANRAWIEQHAMFAPNIEAFVKLAEGVVRK